MAAMEIAGEIRDSSVFTYHSDMSLGLFIHANHTSDSFRMIVFEGGIIFAWKMGKLWLRALE